MNTAEVLNTPGYYYAIAYALSVFVITCTNERKIGRWKLAVVSCAKFALLLFFMTTGRDIAIHIILFYLPNWQTI